LTLLAAATTVAGKAATHAPAVKPTLSPQQQAALQQAIQGAQIQQPQAQMPLTWFQQHAGWLTHGIAGVFIIAAIALVVLLAVQTTKQEGLSGTIGGRVESAYSRMGAEEQLKRVTSVAAFLFVLTGFILSLTGI
jgi:preprotein translocase subunit SecG